MLYAYILQVSAFSGGDPNIALLPNVLKVFLENGQTKSFKYDSATKVKDVVASLQNKLCIKAGEHFALVLEQVKSLRRHKLTLLDPEHTLARVSTAGPIIVLYEFRKISGPVRTCHNRRLTRWNVSCPY